MTKKQFNLNKPGYSPRILPFGKIRMEKIGVAEKGSKYMRWHVVNANI